MINRRDFLIGAGALTAAARPALAALQSGKPAPVLPAMIRADFPGASVETYLNAAAIHPLGTFAAGAIEQTMAFRMRGAGPGRADLAPRSRTI